MTLEKRRQPLSAPHMSAQPGYEAGNKREKEQVIFAYRDEGTSV
jgi:hypothetical protein